jgi:hypothetical protein
MNAKEVFVLPEWPHVKSVMNVFKTVEADSCCLFPFEKREVLKSNLFAYYFLGY